MVVLLGMASLYAINGILCRIVVLEVLHSRPYTASSAAVNKNLMGVSLPSPALHSRGVGCKRRNAAVVGGIV
jgi:hypothetical protein